MSIIFIISRSSVGLLYSDLVSLNVFVIIAECDPGDRRFITEEFKQVSVCQPDTVTTFYRCVAEVKKWRQISGEGFGQWGPSLRNPGATFLVLEITFFFFQLELPEKQFLSISPGAGQISYATGEKAH